MGPWCMDQVLRVCSQLCGMGRQPDFSCLDNTLQQNQSQTDIQPSELVFEKVVVFPGNITDCRDL